MPQILPSSFIPSRSDGTHSADRLTHKNPAERHGLLKSQSVEKNTNNASDATNVEAVYQSNAVVSNLLCLLMPAETKCEAHTRFSSWQSELFFYKGHKCY